MGGRYASRDMEDLQQIIGFWRDCITSEGALEQSFVVNDQFRFGTRTRARQFPGFRDPFIFAEPPRTIAVERGALYDFAARAGIKGQDIHFGYPLLMFYDKTLRQHRVAPLFVMRLSVDRRGEELLLTRGEMAPTLGSKAFEKLGLRQEEIAALNTEVSEVFESARKSKLEMILYLLKRETSMTFVEGIDPEDLNSEGDIHPYSGTVVYNRAVLYANEASTYNLHILNDLDQLVKKRDLDQTALGYLKSPRNHMNTTGTPVLPFAFDEYQLKAIDHIMGASNTVVTGPPGTGKSQFIANLIINLFLQKKRVLFVSHTTEAVRVVNERINEQFANLMMQTGKKEIRQDLGRKLAALTSGYNEQKVSHPAPIEKDPLTRNWKSLSKETQYLRASNALHARLSRYLERSDRMHRSGPYYRLTNWQIAILAARLQRRRSSDDVAEAIEDLKNRHIELSREFVRTNYLPLIFEGDQYGKLVSYIEAVQNRRPASQGTDHSKRYISAALKAMNVWSCTLKSLAATFPVEAGLFDYVIFDEASQIDLPSAAPALYRAKQMVVVGDERQLLHIAKISENTEEDLAKINHVFDNPLFPGVIGYREASLFNSAKRSLTEPEQQLKNHYRSNPDIANLFSTIFYGGGLRLRMQPKSLPSGIPSGVVWRVVKGRAYKHKSGSRYNHDEVLHIVSELKSLIPQALAHHLTIGITTPYAMQQDRILSALTQAFSAEELTCVRVTDRTPLPRV